MTATKRNKFSMFRQEKDGTWTFIAWYTGKDAGDNMVNVDEFNFFNNGYSKNDLIILSFGLPVYEEKREIILTIKEWTSIRSGPFYGKDGNGGYWVTQEGKARRLCFSRPQPRKVSYSRKAIGRYRVQWENNRSWKPDQPTSLKNCRYVLRVADPFFSDDLETFDPVGIIANGLTTVTVFSGPPNGFLLRYSKDKTSPKHGMRKRGKTSDEGRPYGEMNFHQREIPDFLPKIEEGNKHNIPAQTGNVSELSYRCISQSEKEVFIIVEKKGQ